MWPYLIVGASAFIAWWFWDDILIALKGKRVAVLGARATGKTSLFNFLTTGSISSNYEQTLMTEKVNKIRKKIKELDLKIKKSNDFSGDKAAYAEWKEEFDHADLVLYLLRADKILTGDAVTEMRFKDDIHQICKWSNEKANKDKKIFIIGSHCDLDKNYKIKPKGTYLDEFNNLPVTKEIKRKLFDSHDPKNIQVVLGSMDTEEHAEKLVFDIFRQAIS